MASIKKRGKDSWRIVINLGTDPETGKRIRVTETVRGKKQDAEMRCAEIQREVKASNYSLVKPEKITMNDLFSRFLRRAKTHIKRSTFERYEAIIEQHLNPAFGKINAKDLAPHMIMDYYQRALEEGRFDGKGGLSPTTIRQHHAVLRLALKHAVDTRILITNPASSVTPPKKQQQEARFLSKKELNELLCHLRETADNIYVPAYLAAHTGARRGEILGLRWCDVDLEKRTVTIQQSLNWGKGGKLYFSDVKSSSSKRQIALTAENVQVLKLHRQEQLERMMKNRKNYVDQGLVCAEADGTPMNPVSVSSRMRQVMQALGLKASLHSLRHTHATLLIQSGAPMKFVSARLGHATTAFTSDVYGHRTLSDDFRIAELFERTLCGDQSAESE